MKTPPLPLYNAQWWPKAEAETQELQLDSEVYPTPEHDSLESAGWSGFNKSQVPAELQTVELWEKIQPKSERGGGF